MTHLKIEQNNGVIEEVSSAVIDKLYDIVHSGNLDNTSNLIGRLHTTATYQDYIDYLEDTFKVNGVKQLVIDATKKYMSFADPAVLSRMMQYLGDGVGITSSEITNGNWYSNTIDPNTNSTLFTNNTVITSFNELGDLSQITNVPGNAFKGCTSLTSIDLSNITTIGGECFNGDSSLTTIGTLNAQITSIPFGLFMGCTSLVIEDLSLPNLTTLGGYSFEYTKVKQVSNLGSITEIPYHAFHLCNQLISVTIPNTVTLINVNAFNGCTSLSSIDLQNVRTINNGAFYACSSLQTVNNMQNVSSIGRSGFEECTSLTNIDISNVTTLDNYAFKGCTSLTSVDLSSLSGTSSATFQNCTGLQCVDLTGFTTFGSSMFAGCTSLVDLTTSDISNINTGVETCTFNWTTVSDYCFQNASFANKSFNLPEVILIGQDGFSRTKLVSVNAPKVTTIGNYAFIGCTNLQTVTFGDSITSLGGSAFENNTALTTVTFGANSSFSLGSSFYGCSNLTTVTNITNCNKLGTNAFRGCTSLGTNETLELNLTNQTDNPENPFNGTKYKGLILHWPNAISSWRTNYPLWEGMDLEYLDISDTKWPNQVNKVSWYGSGNIETCILSPDFNQLDHGFFDEKHNFKYLILLNPNVVTLENHDNIDRIFRSDYSYLLHIYVPDSLVSSYLADSNWSRTGDWTESFDLSTRILPLSQLPAGVWTTGLASQYLTPAQLATS